MSVPVLSACLRVAIRSVGGRRPVLHLPGGLLPRLEVRKHLARGLVERGHRAAGGLRRAARAQILRANPAQRAATVQPRRSQLCCRGCLCVANLVDIERSSSCQASSCRVRLKSPSRTAIGDRTMAEMNERSTI